MENKKVKVCIALSGGVDSAVAAYMLQSQGYDVIAGFIKVWQPDFLPCSQDEDRVAAKRVAAALGIPFFVVDLADEYKKGIVEYMVDSYTRGETPNPDVTCNKVIKFGGLWTWAQSHDCEYIATGHHAQIIQGKLARGADPAKDQAYFLWELTNDDLAHILLPIGHLQKSDVRGIAEQANLPSATRRDSQGLCFLGSLTMSDFLEHLIENKKGDVVLESGEKVGTHDGAHLFTLGQRGGFVLHSPTDVPMYVVHVDTQRNVITIASSLDSYKQDTVKLRSVVLRAPAETVTHAEIRYHGDAHPVAKITYDPATSAASVQLATKVLVAPGQSCVMYGEHGGVSICVGGGIVCAE
jgi:tRNA-uridine 2-sulfurtransferase